MKAVAVIAIALASPLLVCGQTPGITLQSATITVDPQGTDSYSFEVTFSDLNFEKPDVVQFRIGNFYSTIPFDKFTVDPQTQRLQYQDDTGLAPYWLSSLTIDPSTRKVSAQASRTVVAGLTNPFPLYLGNGATSGCVMVRVRNSGDGTFSLSPDDSPPAPCSIPDAPVLDVVSAGTRANVNVLVKILPTDKLDPRSVALYFVDENAQAQGGPLCRFTAQGNNMYGCTISVEQSSAATVPLMVQASAGDVTLLSPGFTLQSVRPGDETDVQQLAAVEDAIVAARDNFQAYGDSTYARVLSMTALRKLFPAEARLTTSPVGLAPDGRSIEARIDSGLIITMVLNALTPPTSDGPGTESMRSPLTRSDEPLAGFRPGPMRPLQILNRPEPKCGEFKRDIVRNTNVLIWSLLDLWAGQKDRGAVSAPFRASKCPSFQGPDLIHGYEGVPSSLSSFSKYGTVIIETHGGPTRDGRIGMMTASMDKRLALSDPQSYAIGCADYLPSIETSSDVKTGCFVEVLSGGRAVPKLQNTVIFGGFCFSNGMAASMAGASSAFFGYTPTTNVGTIRADSPNIFSSMINEYVETGDLSGDGVSTASVNGNRNLAYVGNPQLYSPKLGKNTVYSITPGSTLDFKAELEGTEKCEDVMLHKWENSANAGHLAPAKGGSGRDRYSSTDSQAIYTPMSVPAFPVDTITVDFLPNASTDDFSAPVAARACTSVAASQKAVSVGLTAVFSYTDTTGPLNVTSYRPAKAVTTSSPFQLSDSSVGGSSKLTVERTGDSKWKITQQVQGPSRTDVFTNTWNRVDLQIQHGPGARQIRVTTDSSITGTCQGVDVQLTGTLSWRKQLDSASGCSSNFELKGFSRAGAATLSLNISVLGARGARNGPGNGTATTTVELIDSTDPFVN